MIAAVIEKSDAILEQEKPAALLLYGDTNSCLAVIAAKRRKIPVFHMEAGNRCFDQRVPEELNRKVVDHLSDINMVLTEHARRYLLAEGIRPETIIKTGSHMHEVLDHYMSKIEQSDVVSREGLERGKYFVISAHREENVDVPENLSDLLESLTGLADSYDFPVIVSTHPRTRRRLDALGKLETHPLVRFVAPYGFTDYVALMRDAACVLSDSGTITEEAALLSIPAVTIRYTHERPEGNDAGVLIMCGLRKESVLDAVRIVMDGEQGGGPVEQVDDYQTPLVSKKVLRTVLSYTDYINRTVWHKG